jgi:hydrogenase maturation protease
VHVPDVHLANPERVLTMAKAMGALPERVAIVGCQPADVDELRQGLSPVVQRAVPVAVRAVAEIAHAWLVEDARAREVERAGV